MTQVNQRGLYAKYSVQRIVSFDSEGDIAEVDPVKEFCFVLKPDSDPIARDALKVYAGLAHLAGYERLGEDLINIVWDLEHPEHKEEEDTVSLLRQNLAKSGRIDTRPREYNSCGECHLRIWRYVGETEWHHDDEIQATMVAQKNHIPDTGVVELPDLENRPPVAPPE